jgi:DNA repair exonuclease SbcCD ATPase subunit
MNTPELIKNSNTLRTQLQAVHGKLEALESQKVKYDKRLKELGEKKILLLKAQGVLDQTITKVSEGGITKIETLVTNGLRLTFPDKDLSFVIDKKTTARGNNYKILLREGEVTGPIMDTFGGGIVNVVQFLFRMILIQRFGLQKFMVLDEVFNNVSAGYRGNVSSLLRTLCDDQGFNILMITHDPVLAAAADRVYEVSPGPEMRPWEQYELDELKAGSYEVRRGSDLQAEGEDSQGEA